MSFSAGPLVLETFFKHFLSHKSLLSSSKARSDDLIYDEGEWTECLVEPSGADSISVRAHEGMYLLTSPFPTKSADIPQTFLEIATK
jgi:hypothetical protein